jgi:5-methylthioadenosine/S-adenosylhomocysteine deaminase
VATTLIHSGTLVCMDGPGTIARGDLLTRDATIAALGSGVAAELEGRAPDVRIDASGCFVLPGFVHGHLHLCQTLMRGAAEEPDLLRWLRERIWPLEAAHTGASIAASAKLGLVELIAGGVTTVNDMGTVRHTETIGAVLTESGVRAVFGKALMDRGQSVPPALLDTARTALDESLELARTFHGSAGGRLRVSLAPRFVLSCTEPLWRDVRDAANELGLMVHTHLAESAGEGREIEAAVGTSAANFFANEAVLGPRFVGAHGVWLEPAEIASIARADAALVHCPGSNLKLGSGLARVRAWKQAGIRCGLGSDGAACNNRLDTFHEMSLASGISRVLGGDAALTAREVVELATCGGARALGLDGVTGSLSVGKQADVIMVDVETPHAAPRPESDAYATLVQAVRAGDVRMTMVAGRVLYHDGSWTTLDPERARAEADAEARGLVRRAEAGVAR